METYLIIEEEIESIDKYGDKDEFGIQTKISLDRMNDIDPVSFPWIISELGKAKEKIERKIKYLNQRN